MTGWRRSNFIHLLAGRLGVGCFLRRCEQPGGWRMPTISARRLRGLPLLLTLVSLTFLTACAATTTDQQPTPTATLAATATTAASPTTPGGSGAEVKVFFSRHPETDGNVNAVFAVKRVSPDLQVATYATQQLIAGPTASEKAQGYFTELTASLTGASNCSGANFQITLDTH